MPPQAKMWNSVYDPDTSYTTHVCTETIDKWVLLHNIRLSMLTLQFFALQHTCNNRDHCQTYSCMSCDTTLLYFIRHNFAIINNVTSSYKHKWRFLRTRKTTVSPLGWCLSEQLCRVVIGKLDFLEHTWSEHSWTSASTVLQDETRR